MELNNKKVTSIEYPKEKLDYIKIRAIQLQFNSRNSLIAHILDEWIIQDKKQTKN